ncbi:DNA primase [Deinococcus psychrotolerans]|uniref:DNA primase n=2 Tax=Deinococcus TaxID=1298 RepID=A0A553USK5_9DEIO|nr:DNA primase [Deinococcus detaillensis]AZI42252.1 DNA primase [Deinococcus psychrotolerans]TSA82981.1 DNA primase [Deinococcus detaillensis]
MGTKEEVRERLSIAEVVGQYVSLTPAGKGRLKGLCPFHNEKTPSFQVDTEQGYYYCFGCKAGGDLFSFVQRTENLSFGDALRKLAEQAGVTVETRYGEKSSRDIYEVNAFALEYFRNSLSGVGLDYFHARGLTEETIAKFELGYAPDGWDGLLSLAKSRGLNERQLLEAGLLSENTQTGRVYDRFRGRVMFPIRDHLSRLVGFGGRVLGDEKPKYLNTPETEAFKKGELLYGLNFARSAAQNASPDGGGELIVVEGYMDVIALHQAGFETAAATLGTALTADHATLLARLDVQKLALMFDRDEAGLKATLSGLDQVVGSKLRVRATRVPSGKDPADAVMAGELHAIRQALASGLDEVHYRVEAAIQKYGVSTTEGKRRILMELLPRMQNLDPFDESAKEMRRLACDPLGLKPEALNDWIANKAKRKTLTDTHLAGMSSQHSGDHELALLRQILLAPALLAKLDGQTPWQNETVKKVMLAARGAKSSEEILEVFRGQPEEQLLIRLLFEGRDPRSHSRANAEQFEQKVGAYAAAAVDDIQSGLSIDSLRTEKDLLARQMASASPEEKRALLTQISELQRAIEAEKRVRRMQA